MRKNRIDWGDLFFGLFTKIVIFVLGVVPVCYILYCVGSVVYVNYIEKPAREKAEQEALAEAREAARIAAVEEARFVEEQEVLYWDKYAGKVFEEIFGGRELIATEYEYLGIVYNVYNSGALFVRKLDKDFAIPEVMEYNGTEFPVIGMYGMEKNYENMGTALTHRYYSWGEETFPANWKYLINVCFADGLTKVVIPETVEYYEICRLPSHKDIKGRYDYRNNTLEEIIIESKFDPREWCFHASFEEHLSELREAGYGDINNEEYSCRPEKFTAMGNIYERYTALKKLEIPEWITSIPDKTDFPTVEVNRIELLPTVTYVNLSAFNHIPLTEFDFYPGVTYNGSIVGWKVKELNLTSDYSFPATVTVADCSELETLNISATTRHEYYPAYVIQNCPNLKTVYIDNGDNHCTVSISGCNNLETVTILNLPASDNNAIFSNVNTGFTLKVPAKYVDYYSVVYEDLNVVSCE